MKVMEIGVSGRFMGLPNISYMPVNLLWMIGPVGGAISIEGAGADSSKLEYWV